MILNRRYITKSWNFVKIFLTGKQPAHCLQNSSANRLLYRIQAREILRTGDVILPAGKFPGEKIFGRRKNMFRLRYD